MIRRPRHRPVKLVPMTYCRQARIALGMSQKKLAQLAGIPQPYVSRMELQRNDVRPDDVAAVAKVLGLDPDLLMKEVTIMEETS